MIERWVLDAGRSLLHPAAEVVALPQIFRLLTLPPEDEEDLRERPRETEHILIVFVPFRVTVHAAFVEVFELAAEALVLLQPIEDLFATTVGDLLSLIADDECLLAVLARPLDQGGIGLSRPHYQSHCERPIPRYKEALRDAVMHLGLSVLDHEFLRSRYEKGTTPLVERPPLLVLC